MNGVSLGNHASARRNAATSISSRAQAEDEFVAMREAKDKKLNMPRLILPAVQINMRGGNLPDPRRTAPAT